MTFTPPDEGLCVVCEETVRLRRDGRTVKHSRPRDPDGPISFTLIGSEWVPASGCLGSAQQPAVRLEMTFARWLRAHHARRDFRENPVSFLAQWVFRPCTRVKALSEVSWASPDELRLQLMAKPGQCDWIGRYIDAAEAGFEAYAAGRKADL
jgi:hypothetical protein